jgi:hypothetical protein
MKKGLDYLVNAVILKIQLFFYFRKHTLRDLEENLICLGCRKVNAGQTRIYTTSNGVGKIVITDKEISINPQLKG